MCLVIFQFDDKTFGFAVWKLIKTSGKVCRKNLWCGLNFRECGKFMELWWWETTAASISDNLWFWMKTFDVRIEICKNCNRKEVQHSWLVNFFWLSSFKDSFMVPWSRKNHKFNHFKARLIETTFLIWISRQQRKFSLFLRVSWSTVSSS